MRSSDRGVLQPVSDREGACILTQNACTILSLMQSCLVNHQSSCFGQDCGEALLRHFRFMLGVCADAATDRHVEILRGALRGVEQNVA